MLVSQRRHNTKMFSDSHNGLLGILNDTWELRDKRIDDWPLMNNPITILCFLITYLLVVLKIGPNLMKNRNAFDIKNVIIIFNVVMLIFNGYMSYQGWIYGFGNGYKWVCQPVDRSDNPDSLMMARVFWLFLICKFLDCMGTVFYILKKKFDHLSGLHVYHHTIMPCLAFIVARFAPGGHLIFNGICNTSVHVIMHIYQLLAALGPKYQKYLWWKRYLTMLQIVQITTDTLYTYLGVYLFKCDIGLPQVLHSFLLYQGVFFLFLFANFYVKTYTKKQHVS